MNFTVTFFDSFGSRDATSNCTDANEEFETVEFGRTSEGFSRCEVTWTDTDGNERTMVAFE